MILYILSIVVTIIFILVLLVKRFLYFRPSSQTYNILDFEELYEGDTHAIYKEGKKDTVILYCHGSTGNIGDRQYNILKFLELGYSILIFDYNGYGKSGGIPNEQLCYSNAYLYMEYLLKLGYKKNNIIPYGEDIGSTVAIYTAIRYNLPKVIIVSTIKNMDQIVRFNVPLLKMLNFLFTEFDTEYYLKNYKGKVLLLHSVDDEIVPYKTISNIHCILVPIKGTHYNPIIEWEIIDNFITQK